MHIHIDKIQKVMLKKKVTYLHQLMDVTTDEFTGWNG